MFYGGSHIGRRRKSVEFTSRLTIFGNQKAEIPKEAKHTSFSSISNSYLSHTSERKSNKSRQSHRMRGSLLLVERTANEKRGRADNEGGSQTKKSRRTENPGGD